MAIISLKLNGDAALFSKVNHLNRKKLTICFLVFEYCMNFSVLAAADMINVKAKSDRKSRNLYF